MRLTIASTRIVLLTKAPRPGHVKSRLIPLLGAEASAALQARLIKHALATIRRGAFREVELHGDPSGDPFLRFCADHYGVTLVEQCAGDLGARMHHAFACAPENAPVLLIGSDCPALTAKHLHAAARALIHGSDCVLVPAEDGGYTLIGLARLDKRLFEGIAWGTSRVLEQTREQLRALGWRWTELETLWDVDTPADYERLIRSGLLSAPRSPHQQRPRRGPTVVDEF